MRDIVQECREILIAAMPANQNKAGLRLAPQAKVDELLHELNSWKASSSVYFTPEADLPEGWSNAI